MFPAGFTYRNGSPLSHSLQPAGLVLGVPGRLFLSMRKCFYACFKRVTSRTYGIGRVVPQRGGRVEDALSFRAAVPPDCRVDDVVARLGQLVLQKVLKKHGF